MSKISDMQSIKICIVGSFGIGDIGDEAMLTADLQFIIETLHIRRDNIFLFGHDVDYMARYHTHPKDKCFSSDRLCKISERYRVRPQFHQMYRDALFRIKGFIRKMYTGSINDCIIKDPEYSQEIQVVINSDVLLVTGGGTINSRSAKGESLYRISKIVSLFRRLGKPIFMSGQTIGPLGYYWNHNQIAKELIESVDVLTVRDSGFSSRYIKLIGAQPKRYIETTDDAANLEYDSAVIPDDINDFIKQGPVWAINTTEYTADTFEKRRFIADLCNHIINERQKRVVFVPHAINDVAYLYSIYDLMPAGCQDSILLPDTSSWKGDMLKNLISRCEVAIGGRYHFIVFAATSNTPFVGMCGNHYSFIKQCGFAKKFNLEHFILNELDTWNMDQLLLKADAACDNRFSISKQIQTPSVSMHEFESWLRTITK